MAKTKPNILVTGTPGTGKTTACELLASATGLRHCHVGEMVKEQELHNGWDDEYDCWVLDEDKVRSSGAAAGWGAVHSPAWRAQTPQAAPWQVCDALEDLMEPGGNVVDYHSCDFFPERREAPSHTATCPHTSRPTAPAPPRRPGRLSPRSSWPPRLLPPFGICRWFDLVVVLQTDNTVLWNRLEKR
jgi:hypothetical protein